MLDLNRWVGVNQPELGLKHSKTKPLSYLTLQQAAGELGVEFSLSFWWKEPHDSQTGMAAQ